MKIKEKIKALLDLVEFSKWQRFVIASVLSFLAYYMFKHMSKLEANQIDWLVNNIIDPGPRILAIIAIAYGLLAFYFSILA